MRSKSAPHSRPTLSRPRLATGEPDRRPRTRAEMIAALKAIAAKTGKGTVTRAEFAKHTGLSREFVHRRCGFSGLVRTAGLRPPRHAKALSEDELMTALREALVARQGVLTSTEFGRIGRYAVETYHARYGGWFRTLAAFAA